MENAIIAEQILYRPTPLRSGHGIINMRLPRMAQMRPNWIYAIVSSLLFAANIEPRALAESETHAWTRSTEFNEASFTETIDGKIRVYVNAPLDDNGNAARATRLIVYSLPAGNTIEQSLGCQMRDGLDWHYDIQHVAAQIRLLRTLMPSERIVLVCPEGPGLSWAPFRKAHPDANARIAKLVDKWRTEFGSDD